MCKQIRSSNLLIATAAVDNCLDTEYAMHLIDPSSVSVQRHYICMTDFGHWSEACNYAVGYARNAGCDMLLLWHSDIIPQHSEAILRFARALEEHDRMDIISGVKQQRNHINRVAEGDTLFMIARTAAFDRLDAPTYTVQGMEVPRYFSEDPYDFAMLCKAAGVTWYEHGGVGYWNSKEKSIDVMEGGAHDEP